MCFKLKVIKKFVELGSIILKMESICPLFIEIVGFFFIPRPRWRRLQLKLFSFDGWRSQCSYSYVKWRTCLNLTRWRCVLGTAVESTHWKVRTDILEVSIILINPRSCNKQYDQGTKLLCYERVENDWEIKLYMNYTRKKGATAEVTERERVLSSADKIH